MRLGGSDLFDHRHPGGTLRSALAALVVRLVMFPIVLRLGGHDAWHRPGWLARIVPHERFAH